jgi:hypothetical protein
MRRLLTSVSFVAVLAGGGLGALVVLAQSAAVPTVDVVPVCMVCQFEVKPSWWQPTGDGSWFVNHIRWTGWTGQYAAGVGTAEDKVCWSNCSNRAEYAVYAVYLLFSDPVGFKGHLVFSRADAISLKSSDARQDMIDWPALEQPHLPEPAPSQLP